MKNLKLCTLFMTLALIPMAIHPMEAIKRATQAAKISAAQMAQKAKQRYQQTDIKSVLKKGFNKVCKSANIALTFGPSMYLGYKYFDHKTQAAFIDEMPDAEPEIQEFAQEQMKAIGHHTKVFIKRSNIISNGSNNMNMGATFTDAIILSDKCPHLKDDLATLLKARKKHLAENNREALKDVEQKLDEYRFVFQHEGNHIKNRDVSLNMSLSYFITPFITHFGLKGLRALIAFVKAPTVASSTVPSIGKSLVNIPAGIAKDTINHHERNIYFRYIEQRADDQVADAIPILKGGIACLKTQDQALDENIKNKYLNYFIKYLHDHPAPQDRIKKFEQRIATLEKKEKESLNKQEKK